MGNYPTVFHFTFLKMACHRCRTSVTPFLVCDSEDFESIEVVEGKIESEVENVFYYEKPSQQIQVYLALSKVVTIDKG